MALTKLTSNLIEGGTGTDWVTAIQTSNFTAEAGKGYFVNTTSQVLYVNLPVGVVGMEITIQDYAGTFATNKVILNANGSEKIQGSALEGRINTNNATAVLIYQDATKGWTSQDVSLNATTISWATPTGQSLTYSTPSPQSSSGVAASTFPTTTFTATLAGSTISGTATIANLPSGITAAQTITGSGVGNTLTVTLTGTFPSTNSLNTALTLSGLTVATPFLVDYLVVAGGGSSGAAGGGGGGAGGLRTSYGSASGGGGSAEASLSLALATNYTVTVGAGAAGVTHPSLGNNGSNSIFSSTTSIGGGGGTGGGGTAIPGGSGGGGSASSTVRYPAGAGITNQGFDGGDRTGPFSGAVPSGGGGGAGAAALDVTGNCNTCATAGGIGLAVSILNATNANTASVGQVSGGSIYYAGGGGGSVEDYGGSGGNGAAGGLGGGSAGAYGCPGTAPSAATVNTGGGSGAPGGCGGAYSNAGGSGVVILRYANTKTLTNPGGGLTQSTGSPFTEGSEKVSVFTAGTGNIQFN